MTSARTPLLFYAGFPLGYHNIESERKAYAFAEWGYDVVYDEGVGIRNPRPHHAVELVGRLGSKLRGARAAGPSGGAGLRASSLSVVPPRQVPPVRALNERWLERQLRALIPEWQHAIAWMRWPTPEVVSLLPRLRPAAIVYDCVDAYHLTPGIVGPWVPRFDAAERQLVSLADAVVVPGENLAGRFRDMAVRPHLIPHGVALEHFRFAPPEAAPRHPPTLGFVGTLDYRLDVPVLRHLATTHPEWRVRLIGPVQEGFSPGDLADLANVSVEPPVPHDQVGGVLASFAACLMPYVDGAFYHAMTPLKTLEILAVGRPAIARPSPALGPYAAQLYLAEDPPGFVRQVERALAEDSEALARARRAVAERAGWDVRLDELRSLLASCSRRA